MVDPSRSAAGDRTHHEDGTLRDRHQGDRSADAVRPRREGRLIRRCRPRQDRDPYRTDRPDRHQCPGWLLGVRRRGGANPRGNRPVARDAGGQNRRYGSERHRPDLHGVWSDERAAGSPSAGRAFRPHHGGILPRHGRGRSRHAAVRRQHLPLLAGGQRGQRAARPHAQRRGLSAHTGHGDGGAPGTDHEHHQGSDHIGAGGLRAGRRSHRPGPGDGVRQPRCVSLPGAFNLGEGHLSGR